MVSEMVALHCEGAAERALVPPFVFFFQLLYPFAWVNDPGHRMAAAAGGTVLIRGAALARVGGIAAMRGALIDDVTLARLVKKAGGRIWLGHSSLATRASGHIATWQMCGAWWRAAPSCSSAIRHGLLAGTVAGMVLVWLVPPLAAIFGHGAARVMGLLAWAAMIATYLPTLRRFRLNPAWAVCLPAAAVFYTAATLGSAVDHYRGARRDLEAAGVSRMSGMVADDRSLVGQGPHPGEFSCGLRCWSVRKPAPARARLLRVSPATPTTSPTVPVLPPADKLARLGVMEAVLLGRSRGRVAIGCGAAAQPGGDRGDGCAQRATCSRAFRQDSTQTRYATWPDLLEYCRFSAMPVGRHVLALHNEAA